MSQFFVMPCLWISCLMLQIILLNYLVYFSNLYAWSLSYLVKRKRQWCGKYKAILRMTILFQWFKYNFSYKCTNCLSLFSAFQKALSFQGIEALYVLTDGKPDTSCSLILKEIERLRKKQDIKIHTISFSCADRYMMLCKNNKTIFKISSLLVKRLCCQSGPWAPLPTSPPVPVTVMRLTTLG